jgi:hypothetical protein
VRLKGHVATADGLRSYPLTIIDAHSRYLIRVERITPRKPRETDARRGSR